MVKPLPSRFNPDLMARDGTRFETEVPLDQMARLSALLLDADNSAVWKTVRPAIMTALFSQRKDVIVVNGRLRASYPLQCQRCLEPMMVTIDEPYELVFVENEQVAEKLDKELDPVVLDEKGYITIVELYEDELILHLPTIPRHEDHEQCSSGNRQFGELPEAVEEEGRRRPFDVLKDLNLH